MRSRCDTGHVCQRKQLVIEFDAWKVEFGDQAQDIEGFVERAAQHLGHWLEVALVVHRAESISASVPSEAHTRCRGGWRNSFRLFIGPSCVQQQHDAESLSPHFLGLLAVLFGVRRR